MRCLSSRLVPRSTVSLSLVVGLMLAVRLLQGAEPSGSVPESRPDREDPVAPLRVQQGWEAYDRNPCICFGDFRFLASWNDPCVLQEGSRYVMYLTTSLGMPGRPPVQPFRAVSENGVGWRLEPNEPLLTTGPGAEDFDYQSVETPSVVSFGGKYHLYYTGVQKGLSGPMAIGHATSPDGVAWSKDPANPILRPTGRPADFNGLQVAEPGAVVFQGKLHLYFAAVGVRPGGSPPARRVIALAKSVDGSTFTDPQIALEQDAPYLDKLGFDGYSAPSAAVYRNRVHLFCDVGYFDAKADRKWRQVALHHAVSANGETDWIQDAEAIFTSRSFPWTALEVRSPAVLFDEPSLKLWFAGNAHVQDFLPEVRSTRRTAKFGIGSAIIRLDRFAGR